MSLESFEKDWYALQTYSGYEKKVARDLLETARNRGLEDYITDVLVPMETRTEEKKNGELKVIEENVFPGYVLVEMVMTDETWFIVRNTTNVTGFVGSSGAGQKPAPLLPEEIIDIKRMMGLPTRTTNLNVAVGDVVQITFGAFKDMSGVVTDIDEHHHKLKVEIEMFGRQTSTELDFDQVEAI